MLKQDNSAEISSQPAAQVRVTPEELASAIARIEARQDAGKRETEGTVVIGEVIQELGLAATPEEVLTEVQNGRQQQAKTKKHKPSIAERLVLTLGLGGILLGLGLGGFGLSQIQNRFSSDRVTSEMISVSRTPQTISLAPDLLVGNATGKLVMLSEVGDNQPVYCRYSDGSFQQFQTDNKVELWQLIKHDGRVYVRGRMLKMSSKVFSSNGADVTTIDNDPAFALPVTLPISGFQVVPGAGSTIEFHAVDIHLDKHAWERWQP